MLLIFNNQIVFGLLALCVFHLFFVETQAKFKFPSIRRRQQSTLGNGVRGLSPSSLESQPSTSSETMNLQRIPSHTSMTSVNLKSPSLSSSSTSLNTANSPSLMKEVKSLHASIKKEATALHKQAASTLGGKNLNPIRAHRAKQHLKQIGTVAKYSGLGLAAIGGAVTIVKSFSTDERIEKIKRIENNIKNIVFNTTPKTIHIEFDTLLGKDK